MKKFILGVALGVVLEGVVDMIVIKHRFGTLW